VKAISVVYLSVNRYYHYNSYCLTRLQKLLAWNFDSVVTVLNPNRYSTAIS